MPNLGLGLTKSGVNKKFVPSDISNLSLWLDASVNNSLYSNNTGGSVVSNTGTIGRIEDLSGNNNHATQSTTFRRATYLSNTQKGLGVIRFDGVYNFYNLPTSSLLFASSGNAFNFFIVCIPDFSQSNQNYGGGGILRKMDGTSTLKEYYFGIRNNGKIAMNFLTENNSILSTSTCTNLTPVILGVEFDFSSGSTYTSRTNLYINNSLQTKTAESGSSGWGSGVELGRGYDGSGSYYFKNDLCEVLVYNSSMTNSDKQKVYNYLNNKWI